MTDWFLAASQKREAVLRRMLGGRNVFITKLNSDVVTLSILHRMTRSPKLSSLEVTAYAEITRRWHQVCPLSALLS